jgi:hypothetical protein
MIAPFMEKVRKRTLENIAGFVIVNADDKIEIHKPSTVEELLINNFNRNNEKWRPYFTFDVYECYETPRIQIENINNNSAKKIVCHSNTNKNALEILVIPNSTSKEELIETMRRSGGRYLLRIWEETVYIPVGIGCCGIMQYARRNRYILEIADLPNYHMNRFLINEITKIQEFRRGFETYDESIASYKSIEANKKVEEMKRGLIKIEAQILPINEN